MKMNFRSSILATITLMSVSQFALAVSVTPTKSIAEILSTLNHAPTAEQRAELLEIGNDAAYSSNIQAIAQAVHNIRHSATVLDKKKMTDIAEDPSATISEQTLAKVVAEISHAPDSKARRTLASIN